MRRAELLMSLPTNETFLVAMVLLVGFFLGLWATMLGKGS